MKRKSHHTRPLADFLTVSRVVLCFIMAGIGWTRGEESLPTAVLILILCWFTDLIDGPLARLDTERTTSWVGRHDADADVCMTLAVTAYLVFCGYLKFWFALLIVVLALVLRETRSPQLAWPLGAFAYFGFGVVTFRSAPIFGWMAVGYLVLLLVVRWPRVRDQYIPSIKEILRGSAGKPEPHSPGWKIRKTDS